MIPEEATPTARERRVPRPGYPLFFDYLDEASEKLENEEVAPDAHPYLHGLDHGRWGTESFVRQPVSSGIYRDLPAPD